MTFTGFDSVKAFREAHTTAEGTFFNKEDFAARKVALGRKVFADRFFMSSVPVDVSREEAGGNRLFTLLFIEDDLSVTVLGTPDGLESRYKANKGKDLAIKAFSKDGTLDRFVETDADSDLDVEVELEADSTDGEPVEILDADDAISEFSDEVAEQITNLNG
jgi:hypothetical protein